MQNIETDRIRAYDRLYPEHRFGGYCRHDGAIAFYTRIQALLQPHSIVCDFGCGRGFHKDLYQGFARELQSFRGRAARVIGIDVDDYASDNPYIDEFRRINPGTAALPLADASVDLVVTEWVVEHLPDPRGSLLELSRIIRPGGYLCIRTPNRWHYSCIGAAMIPDRWHHKVRMALRQPHESSDVFPTLYRCNTRRQLSRQLAECGFESCVHRHRGPSHLTEAGNWLGIFGEYVERLSPPVLRHELHAFGRKLP